MRWGIFFCIFRDVVDWNDCAKESSSDPEVLDVSACGINMEEVCPDGVMDITRLYFFPHFWSNQDIHQTNEAIEISLMS